MSAGPEPHVRLLDDARHAAAVAGRAQQRVLREIDQQDATLVGSLEELAEVRAEVVLHTTVGRRLQGTVRALTADHVVLDGPHGRAWVRVAVVTLLRVPAREVLRPGGGERPPRPSVGLADALIGLVDRLADVEVLLEGGGSVRGTALAATRDLLTLHEPTGAQALVHLPCVAIVTTADH